MSKKVENAMHTLKRAFKLDKEFAHSWHCNLACSAMDAGVDPKIANDAAANFMKLAFDIDTRR